MPSCFLLSRYAWSYKTGLSSPKERNGREKRKPKSERWGVTTHLWSGRKSWQWSDMESKGNIFEDVINNIEEERS